MGTPPDLAVAEIVRRLDAPPGPALYIGPLALARSLSQRRSLLVVDERLRPAKLARQAQGLAVLRCAAHVPPLAQGSLTALIVVDRLARLPDLAEGIACWIDLLRPGGELLLLEKLRLSPTLRTLGRALGGRVGLAPEDLTACLLGAGLGRIGQQFYSSSFVITRGCRLALPQP